MAEPIKVLGFAGSLRAGSFNRAALRAAGALAPSSVLLTTYDLSDIPLYNGDLEREGLPESVVEFGRSLAEADALLIVTPEYNYSIPGVLKNAIDWASRIQPSPLAGKATAIMGASMGGFGSARAQYHLRQVCVYLDLRPINKPEVFISAAHTKFDTEGVLTDDEAKKSILTLLESLANAVQANRD